MAKNQTFSFLGGKGVENTEIEVRLQYFYMYIAVIVCILTDHFVCLCGDLVAVNRIVYESNFLTACAFDLISNLDQEIDR